MPPAFLATTMEPSIVAAARAVAVGPATSVQASPTHGTEQNSAQHAPFGGASIAQHSNRLDMEGVFFRLHSRLVHSVNRWTSPSCRWLMEVLILLNAFILLFTLCYFHVKYVSRAESNCVTEVLRRELGFPLTEGIKPPQVIRLQVSGIWSHLGREDAKSSEKLTKVMRAPSDGSLVAANLFKVWLQDPVYVYSSERGFLMLDESTRQQFKMSEVAIRLKTETECFVDSLWGETERYLLDNFIGYDTVILNAFGALFESRGYLYSVHSRDLLNVAHVHSNGVASRASTMAFKLGALATTLFLFFITTTLVHHTLRETQERMLKFTVDLQSYVRRGIGYRNLVLNHVVGSLVFVPIMVGMLFFLFEFFNDQLLAFIVLAIVWVCELFSVMSLRTAQNLLVFPRLFFLYFCSFHLYFFLFPSGFSYMALTCCVIFLQHSMLSFFSRYEMPAMLSGRINVQKQREILGQIDDPLGGGNSFGADLMTGNATASLAVRALTTGSRANSFVFSATTPAPVSESAVTNSASNTFTVATSVTLNTGSSNSSPAPVPAGNVGYPPRQNVTRRKRSTIHTEPAAPPVEQATGLNASPPPPVTVGPRWSEGYAANNAFDGVDDNSSQNSGWEIGGYG